MKVVLEFNLPEDREEYEWAFHGSELQAVVLELDTYLRNKIKYRDAGKETDDIRAELHKMLGERGLSI
jgi:hypothetical protein